MSISTLILVVWAFLAGAAGLGWFSVSNTLLSILLVVFAIVCVLEAASVIRVGLPVGRRRTIVE